MRAKSNLLLFAIVVSTLGLAFAGYLKLRPDDCAASPAPGPSETRTPHEAQPVNPPPTTRQTENEAADVSASQQGRRVFIDPETGRIVPPPANPQPSIRQRRTRIAVSSSQTGLRERKSPVAGGGTIVDLQGRFQSTVSVKVDGAGTPCLICSTTENPGACTHGTVESETVDESDPTHE